MILLASTSDKLQLISGSAGALSVNASYVDYDSTTPTIVTPARKNTSVTTAATTDVVTSPGSSTIVRNIKHLNICNTHAVNSNAVEVQHTDGTTIATLVKYTIGPGETLSFVEGNGWRVLDASGNVKMTVTATPGSQSPTIDTISTNYTLAADLSIVTVRTLTINSGKKLALASGARWRIL